MAARDEPPDPAEALEAAEAAHLAVRRTVRGPAAQPDHDPDPATAARETVPVPRQRSVAAAYRRGAPLPVAGGVAALWSALVTFLPVAVVVTLLQAAEDGPLAIGAPVRVAAAGWLLAHGAPVQTQIGEIGLAPLALSVFAAWRVARAGLHVVRAQGAVGSGSFPAALVAAVAVALAYGLIGVLAAAAVGGPAWVSTVLRAAATMTGFGLLAAGYGALRATGAAGRLTARVPVLLRAAGRAGVVAGAGVLASGAATAGTALAVGGGPAAEMFAAYGTGVPGQAGLTLLCLVYAPNLSVWAAAYLVGPGFAVGTDTVVRSSEVVVDPLPALPVFAALPTGPLPTLGAALLVAPVLVGGVAGWSLARGLPGRPAAWPRLAAGALLAGVVAGVLVGLAALASGGPLGDGQLAVIGPDPVLVAGSTAATVAPSALLGAGAAVALARRRR
jgi:hypothetical protein